MYKNNVFLGKNSIIDFLNPKNHPMVPLVEIPKVLNPFYDDGVRIFVKLMNTLPLLNVKSLPAYNMLINAKNNGEFEEVNNLIENSSGNTVFSLAVIAKNLGISNTHAFVSYEVPKGKLDMLKLFGVKPIINKEPICPDPSDKKSGIYMAKKMGQKKGFYNAGQYENEFNPKSHFELTAPQIYEQLNGNVQIFCSGLGTTGTMVGSSKYFKSKNRKIKTVGVIRTPNNPVPGVRTRGLLNMIAFNWKDYVDEIEEVGTKESFINSLNLIRNGIIVGPSSGFSYAGLLSYLKKSKKRGELKNLKNKKGLINAVFIACDTPFIYLDEYFKYLDKKNFPKIKNEKILLYKNENELNNKTHKTSLEIDPKKAFKEIFNSSKKEIEKKLSSGQEIKTKILVIDIRDKYEFYHYSIPGSINLDENKVVSFLKKKKVSSKEKIIFVCRLGLRSYELCLKLRKLGFNVYNLSGGTTIWSDFNYPRKKPNVCYKINKN